MAIADDRADVVIVGAGVIGCSIAYELARRGARVATIDPREVGRGATQAAAGLLAPYIEGHDNAALRDLGARSLRLYDEFVERVSNDAEVSIRYGMNGTLEVATDEESAARLRSAEAALRSGGVAHQILDRAQTRDAEPLVADEVVGGRIIDDHRFVAAAELTAALARAAERQGARFTCGEPAVRIGRCGSCVRVQTPSRALDAPAVVLAAGSWSSRVAVEGADPPPVRPIRGQLLHLDWRGPPLQRVTWGARCYLVPWANESLLVGATVEDAGFDERATVAGVRDLLEAACDLVPAVWRAGFTAANVGLRPATPDELPIVGPSTRVEGLVYATGHYRNGILLAPLTAQLVADFITKARRDPAMERLSPQRFGAL